MPLCTTCTRSVPHLYTLYESAHNLRLEQCPKCQTFADPYVEHDTLTLVLDLILLKLPVYRHLLFNRGSEPRQATHSAVVTDEKQRLAENNERWMQREKARWSLVLRLGLALVSLDAFIRWTHLNSSHYLAPREYGPWMEDSFRVSAVFKTFLGCLIETVSFHIGIIVSCMGMSSVVERFRRTIKGQKGQTSGVRDEFRLSLIPLALLYSSLTKLFLLFLLSIWRPSPSPSSAYVTISSSANDPASTEWYAVAMDSALQLLDDDTLDREWVVRNVLGGLSAGFGLRVILDWHPTLTTLIIFAGWGIKTLVSALLISGWVSQGGALGGEMERLKMGEAWLAYSIP